MSQPLIAQQWIARHLANALNPIPVVPKVPRQRPDSFVRVHQLSVSGTNYVVDETHIAVQTYAPTMKQAYELAYRARTALWDVSLDGDNMLGWDEKSGPVEFPDPDLKDTVRVQFTGYAYTYQP